FVACLSSRLARSALLPYTPLFRSFLFDVAATFYLIAATSYVYLAAPTREDRIDVEVGKTWVGNISSAVATVVATQLHVDPVLPGDRQSTRLNSSHVSISYAVFCLQ